MPRRLVQPAPLMALLALVVCGVVVALQPRSPESVTTITFSPGPGISPTTISWNDVRRTCFGKLNGTTVSYTESLSIRCVR